MNVRIKFSVYEICLRTYYTHGLVVYTYTCTNSYIHSIILYVYGLFYRNMYFTFITNSRILFFFYYISFISNLYKKYRKSFFDPLFEIEIYTFTFFFITANSISELDPSKA